MLGKSATAMQGCTFMHIIFVSKPKTICYQKQKHDFHYIIIITIKLKGSVEKGHQRFLAKIKHCQNCSKSHTLVCLGVAKNVLSFFRQNMQKKSAFLPASLLRTRNKRIVLFQQKSVMPSFHQTLQLLGLVFVMCCHLWLITSILIILDIIKTSCNNKLLCGSKNVHTPLQFEPPPPRIFHSRGLYITPPHPLAGQNFFVFLGKVCVYLIAFQTLWKEKLFIYKPPPFWKFTFFKNPQPSEFL